MYSLEQGYLKIFQSFHSKANRKIPPKFEHLAESFFETLLTKELQDNPHTTQTRQTLEMFNSFLALCSEGIYSSIMNIRVMCCRLVFLLLKLIPPHHLESYLTGEVQDALLNSTLHLLRTRVSTYRQLGVKLASLILNSGCPKGEEVEQELFKILSVEDNDQIRKLVMTNLSIRRGNLEDLLVRLRDKNPEIRTIVAKKLQGEKFKLEDMTISNLYKLLYDGYGSKEAAVKKECLLYFSTFFINPDTSMADESRNLHS
jgi:hypothetical protein